MATKATRKTRQQPESLRLRGVMPTLTVSDIHRSIAFYHETLGFTIKDRWEHEGALMGAEMVAGAVTIGLTQDDFSKGRDRVKGVGQRLWCTTAQNVDRLAEEIQRRGGHLDEGPMDAPWGAGRVRMLTLTDPDGFRLSITSGE
jgi:uncharacterized glyoxalase superfamily protein PhnB